MYFSLTKKELVLSRPDGLHAQNLVHMWQRSDARAHAYIHSQLFADLRTWRRFWFAGMLLQQAA